MLLKTKSKEIYGEDWIGRLCILREFLENNKQELDFLLRQKPLVQKVVMCIMDYEFEFVSDNYCQDIENVLTLCDLIRDRVSDIKIVESEVTGDNVYMDPDSLSFV